jgi:NAD(P)-dependent dehydrogenase (short-subunit alcohol dehydrogenase family)
LKRHPLSFSSKSGASKLATSVRVAIAVKEPRRQMKFQTTKAADAERSQSGVRKILLIGASRGLGLGLAKLFAARGWNVVATERGSSAGLKAAAAEVNGRVRIERVDITNHDELNELHRRLSGELFDVIFIIAGVHDDTTKPIHAVPVSEVARLFITNAYSPIYLAEAVFDLLQSRGTLAIMSSRMGSVSLATTYAPGEWETYRASKAALNMLARCFYQRHQDGGRTVLIMHPGWVKTDMGGDSAPVDLTTSVEGLYNTLEKWRGSGKEAFVDFEGNVLPW